MHSHEFDVIFHDFPMPPVAITIDFALKTTKFPRFAPVSERAHHAVAVGQQLRDRALHVHVEAELHAAVLQRADHFKAGAVAHVAEALVGVPAERALQDFAVRGAVKKRAPLLELVHSIRRFDRVQLRHAPVVEHFPAAHRVAEMDLPAVRLVDVAHRRGKPALSHHGVRLAKQGFAHDADASSLRERLDRGSQARAARADNQHIVFVSLVGGSHRSRKSLIAPEATR